MSVPNKIFFGIGIQQYNSGLLPDKTIENIRLLGDTLKTDYGFQESKYLLNNAATKQSIELHLQSFKSILKPELFKGRLNCKVCDEFGCTQDIYFV